MPAGLWMFIGVYFVVSGAHLPELYYASGIGRTFSTYVLVLYVCLIGNQLFGKSRIFGPKTGKFGLPCAEFILTRPFERRRVQRFFCGFYLGIVLLPVLITGALMLGDPDLPVALHPQNRPPGMLQDAFARVSDYQAQFPGGTVRSVPDSSEKVFVIPHGRLLAVGWELGMMLLVTSETLLRFQSRLGLRWPKLEFGPITIAFYIITLAAQFRATNAWPDQAFYFFCHHWPWFALGVAAYVTWAWRVIARDGSELEL
jgi:hypothetical protein